MTGELHIYRNHDTGLYYALQETDRPSVFKITDGGIIVQRDDGSVVGYTCGIIELPVGVAPSEASLDVQNIYDTGR